jgi:predicted site-specific integrase-resolvase
MLAPDDAALALSISARTIYRWVEEAKIHFRENANGALVVCLGSIREQLVSP